MSISLPDELPLAYQEQMKRLFEADGEPIDPFLDSYREPRAYGLRVQPWKWNGHETARRNAAALFGLEPVPWCPEGYYYEESSRPGKHPYHHAGLYYIQEPSAMSSAELLDPQPGELVLDLAAAPGGKATQIAGRMKGEGLLIANEIHPQRAKILAENMERMGVVNCIVTQADPHALAERFPYSFDRIMLDAPCSGEGMFRKDPEAVNEWSPEHVEACALRQRDIIRAAVRMLRPGGSLVYSTCTFNRRENEDIIAHWLETYPEFELVRMERLWPHRHRGEGHFVALLKKSSSAPDATDAADGSASAQSGRRGGSRKGKGASGVNAAAAAFRQYAEWAREHLPGLELPPGRPLLFGDELYYVPDTHPGARALLDDASVFSGLRLHRLGLHLAHLRKNRLEPAHALAMACTAADQAALRFDAAADDPRIAAYLRGEPMAPNPEQSGAKGWTLVAVDGLPIGWGKASDGLIKNHLPKGLRALG
ncbi:RNA methyltransferase [Paenibacillus dendritiformis]|uniref:RsmB/NOP family class I SAM-dependent RNA methyltransferase n=1 Tax=Paenibacillus dendritiformis TaxID=130049 RepID=UPI00143DEC0C|nr:RsmB/NOP family class I SAM-dependent RNA methyltransferase [Paenibacillus dendritiformis]NKI22022.1 RNA methyltransferase [Paenibacillus dendritiformis]NRF96581.1 RsmF rRNA methyltransferase first C-terminal domain-containing protein [Paenibacillus dendritiformis]